MEEWLQQIKDDWNKTSDSEWYQSLRTDEKIEELLQNPRAGEEVSKIGPPNGT